MPLTIGTQLGSHEITGRLGKGGFMIRLKAALLFAMLAIPGLSATAEQIVSISGGKAPLYGTLERPAGPAGSGAAILIIAGSGTSDRNGNSPPGFIANPLKQLAEALAANGVLSLRFDKRGVGASAPASPLEIDLRLGTFVDDAVNWASWLCDQEGVRCVVMAGHSEGALIALLAAQKTDVCGVVLLEGAGRPLAEELREGFLRQPEPVRSRALSVLDELSAGRSVADPPPQLAAILRPTRQPYLMSEMPIDPTVEIRKLRAPLLIVHGDADQQMTATEFERLKAARPHVSAVQVKGMDHLLKLNPSGGIPAGLADLPLAPDLAKEIVRFVKGVRFSP
jgi:pimeloyl-ACP methyl ester carboxylesterase